MPTPAIRKAAPADVTEIKRVTKAAFTLYQNELNPNVKVDALSESDADILADIAKHTVFVAEDAGRLLGAIRYAMLNSGVAYVYRFAVDHGVGYIGLGSDLLKAAIADAQARGAKAITLYTNAKYFTLARYYYGKEFFVHSTDHSKGYIRALFVKELIDGAEYDITPAIKK